MVASTLLLLLLGGTASTALALSFDEFEELRTTIHKLPPAESKRRILQAAAAASPPPHQDKIDHLVVSDVSYCASSLAAAPRN